jgi:hypothetical protein
MFEGFHMRKVKTEGSMPDKESAISGWCCDEAYWNERSFYIAGTGLLIIRTQQSTSPGSGYINRAERVNLSVGKDVVRMCNIRSIFQLTGSIILADETLHTSESTRLRWISSLC